VIEPGALLAWSALALAVTLSPGPDTILVASHGARGGFRAGLAAVGGIQAGMVWYAALFGLGLLRLLAAVPALFLAVKIAGAIYLAWLGAQLIWRAVTHKQSAQDPAHAPTLSKPFRQAFLTNILNPKVALFYLAALPQFASGPDAPLVGALLIGVHGIFGALWLSFVAFAASRARTITWNRTFVRWLEGAIGAFFVSVAGRLALAQR
jgi:threonine/homoserine/homoserine lactone efflux protein